MYSYIIGQIEYKDESTVVLECGGIGYDISISSTSSNILPVVGAQAKVFTYLVVKEDGISLVGFATKEEKSIFEKLITVSGVGPKLALGVLSGMPYQDLIICILKEDSNAISKIKGVGKKTSERIVLELKDKMMEENIDIRPSESVSTDSSLQSAIDDGIQIMISLGLSKTEATNLIKNVATAGDSVEDIISKALREMN